MSDFALTLPRKRIRPPRTGIQQWYHHWLRIIVCVDATAILLAMGLVYLLRFGWQSDPRLTREWGIPYAAGIALASAIWFAVLRTKRTAAFRVLGAGQDEYRRVLDSGLATGLIMIVISYFTVAEFSRAFLLAVVPIGTTFLLIGRWLTRKLVIRDRGQGRGVRCTLIVGDAKSVMNTIKDLTRNPAAGFLAEAAFLTDAQNSGILEVPWYPYAELDTYLSRQECDAVVVAAGVDAETTRHISWQLEDSRTPMLLAPRLTDVTGPRLIHQDMSDLHLIEVQLPEFVTSRLWGKRIFDLIFASAALILLSPILLLISLAIKFEDGGPVFFRQERVGLGGESFIIHKFRSMRVDAEARLAELQAAHPSESNEALFKLHDDPRITRVGKFIRKYSLDELPQFWTVLRGNMSVVGPRPHLSHELDVYPNHGLRRLLMKPGITGLWQVSGRSDLPLEDAVRLDLRYIENWSLTGDIMLILRTIKTVLTPKGAY